MNKGAIRATAVCRFNAKEKVYVVASPLLDICVGAAETEKESWEIYDDLLQAFYVEYLEGKVVGLYGKRGRPAKGGIAVDARVKPPTKDGLDKLSDEIGCSLGEVIDYLLAFQIAYKPTAKKEKSVASKSTVARSTRTSKYTPTRRT